MLQLAKEVHKKACEEQKKICAGNAKCTITFDDSYEVPSYYYDLNIDEDSILNSPNAKFE